MQAGLELPIQEMWQRLAKAVHEIHNHNSSTLSYEENYRYAYNFVLVSEPLQGAVKLQLIDRWN